MNSGSSERAKGAASEGTLERKRRRTPNELEGEEELLDCLAPRMARHGDSILFVAPRKEAGKALVCSDSCDLVSSAGAVPACARVQHAGLDNRRNAHPAGVTVRTHGPKSRRRAAGTPRAATDSAPATAEHRQQGAGMEALNLVGHMEML